MGSSKTVELTIFMAKFLMASKFPRYILSIGLIERDQKKSKFFNLLLLTLLVSTRRLGLHTSILTLPRLNVTDPLIQLNARTQVVFSRMQVVV